MKLTSPRYLRFKLAFVTGSLLGLVMLAVSIVTFFEVNQSLVTTELRREVQRQLNWLVQETYHQGIEDPADLKPLLDEMLRLSPREVAWVRVYDDYGNTFGQSGTPIGPILSREKLSEVAGGGTPPAELRGTPNGKALVVTHYVRLTARPPEPMARDRSQPSRHFVEIAVYWDSASEEFVGLRADLILNLAVAIGLVLSMALLWSRLPHYIRGKQLEQEAELARQVQADLFPPEGGRFTSLDFAARCVPAAQVGGDFYDVFSVGDGRTAMVLGDVSGHGMSAAVLMGLLLGSIRTGNWATGAGDHEDASQRLSELLRSHTSAERFASLFWCYYEAGSHQLRYVNAGHPPPLLLRRDERGAIDVRRLTEGGPVLGVVPQGQYQQAEVLLSPGDVLVFFSDGVLEAENVSDEQFGEERLLQAIRGHLQLRASELRDEILRCIHVFLGDEQASDDLTLMVVRISDG